MTTPNLALTTLEGAQSQKHITINEAFARLDAAAQLSVITRDAVDPPAGPADGARYLLGPSPTGDWTDHPNAIAAWDDAAQIWLFFEAREGWRCWIEDEQALFILTGGAWQPASSDISLNPVAGDMLGIGTMADGVNRLALRSSAALFTHDDSGSTRLALNKATPPDTASILLQTGYSARAELGLTGDDAFHLKIAADGTSFTDAFTVDPATASVQFSQPPRGVAPPEFGDAPVITAAYAAARGSDLFANGSGLLGNGYNHPPEMIFDPATTPNLPASFRFEGRHPGLLFSTEFVGVDPNQTYRLRTMLRQQGLPGDFSAHPDAERHRQYMGIACYDADLNLIWAEHHIIHNDSRTTLSQPLAPGDTQLNLTDASNWENTSPNGNRRRVILFGYRNSFGALYRDYSRLIGSGWDVGGVNFASNTVTLTAPFPASLGNPDDPSGIWPAGTQIANAGAGAGYKYSFFAALTVPELDRWYQTEAFIGGIDTSGTNRPEAFSPGTAFVKVFWRPNFTNRPGGFQGFPDTGAGHAIWFAGTSITPEPMARIEGETLHVPRLSADAASVEVVANPTLTVTPLQ